MTVEFALNRAQKWQPNPYWTTTVRLSSDARLCVVFLGHSGPKSDVETFSPSATGFFLHHHEVTYLVTAKHCVTRFLSDPFDIRFNTKAGGAQILHIDNPDWIFHDDLDVDVAAMELEVPPESDCIPYNLKHLLTEKRLSIGDFAAGDITYTVGVFHFHSGKKRNVPLVHTGHIATFPTDELIEVENWDKPKNSGEYKNIQAFIVQCQALPAASGAPVFVRKPIGAADELHTHRPDGSVFQGNKRVPPDAYGAVFMLGLWHGAWEINPTRVVGMAKVRDPAGYGIVVPAQKIIEVLDMPKAKAGRKAREAAKARNLPSADAILPAKDTQERFDATVRAMLDSPPKPRVSGK